MGVSALRPIGLQSVALDTGLGAASALSEETHQTDTANHRIDCIEGDSWRASGSFEDLGASSVGETLFMGGRGFQS
jgi:hypothetical protein